jgi:hypothetical protein
MGIALVVVCALLYAFNTSMWQRIPKLLLWWHKIAQSVLDNGVVLPDNIFTWNGASYVIATSSIALAMFLIAMALPDLPTHLRMLITGAGIPIAIILFCLVLGIMGQLTATALFALAVSFLFATLLLLLCGKNSHKRITHGIGQSLADFSGLIRDVRNCALSVALLFYALFITLTTALIAWAYHPYGYDATAYHLPPIASWIQDGGFTIIDTGVVYSNCYPKNANLLVLWNTIFLDSDVLVRFTQFYMAFLGSFALYALLRKLSIARNFALAGALSFFLTPIVVAQASFSYIDLSLTTMTLCAIVFFVHYMYQPSVLYALLFGISAGICCGMKATAPLYVGVMGVLILLKEASALFNKSTRLWPALARLHIIALAVLACGSFWYFRSWYYYGSPVWPFPLAFGGVDFGFPYARTLDRVADGTTWDALMTEHFGPYTEASLFKVLSIWWFEKIPMYIADGRSYSGFGIQWVALTIPLTLYALLHSLFSKQYRFIAITALILVLWLLNPAPLVHRYNMILPGMSAISLAYALQNMHRPARKVLIAFSAVILFVNVALISLVNENYVRPEGIIKALQGKRAYATCHTFDFEKYAELVPAGSTVGIGYTKFRYVLDFYGSDWSRRPILLPSEPEELIKKIAENDLDFFVIPKSSPTLQRLEEAGFLKDADKHFLAGYAIIQNNKAAPTKTENTQ